MALLSVLTPVLALVLCLVIGYMVVKSRDPESTSRSPGQAAKVDSRPWIDQDLQDDTEDAHREDGKRTNNVFFKLSPTQSGSFTKITDIFKS